MLASGRRLPGSHAGHEEVKARDARRESHHRKTIDGVIDRLPPDASTGAIAANLTLGFWVHLSDRSREAAIWRTALYHAWPKGTDRQKLQPRLEGILCVRNRVAHAERLFDPSCNKLSPLRADAEAAELLRDLCPEAAEHLYGNGEPTPVKLFCKENPAPAGVRLWERASTRRATRFWTT